ncbi:hypothetical protein BDW68DRAFT_180283 [Aspergillus falconensis]
MKIFLARACNYTVRATCIKLCAASCISTFLSRSAANIEADYDKLYRRQQRILSYVYGTKTQIQSSYGHSYHQLTYNERRMVELSLLHCLAQIVAKETCLFGGLVPAYLTPEYVNVLDFYDSIMARFPSTQQFSG